MIKNNDIPSKAATTCPVVLHLYLFASTRQPGCAHLHQQLMLRSYLTKYTVEQVNNLCGSSSIVRAVWYICANNSLWYEYSVTNCRGEGNYPAEHFYVLVSTVL